MAEMLNNNEMMVEMEIPFEPDSLAEMVQSYFQQAKEYRVDEEQIWKEAHDAFRSTHPERIDAVHSLAQKRGVFIHLVRRRVNSAKVKISSLLFESGKVPFDITPNLKPKFISPDLAQLPPELMYEEVKMRAERMEKEIRDVLTKSDYVGVINDSILEMCLYGTGCTKAVVLKNHNYPVYKTAKEDPILVEAEDFIESELIPMVEFVSCWDLFPTPEATSIENADWVIQRAFYSQQELRNLSDQNGFIPEAIEEAISTGSGIEYGSDQSESPVRYNRNRGERIKKFQVLEMWGEFPIEDLEKYMDIPEGIKANLSVCVTVCGGKVIRVVMNPFDGRIPYDMCYWERNPESIWGDGIYFSIRDLQDITNFAFAQMVEGKALASNPMSVIDPQAFDDGEDLEDIRPGKMIRVRPGNDVNSAFRPVIIPDVTSGLDNLIQMVERQADIASGQSAIGMGESSAYQTKTATGMSILQSNSNKLTAEVVRSVSNMISKNVQAVYHWLMADSDDLMIKGDYDAQSTGFMQYVAKEVHNTQLLNLLNILGQNPDLRAHVKMNALVRPIFRAFSLDPEGMVMTPDEKIEEDQMQQQMAMQLKQYEEESKMNQSVSDALLKEKMAVSADQRKADMREREILMSQGNVLSRPTDYENDSILLKEQKMQEQEQEIMAEMQNQSQDAELDQMEQELENMEQAGARIPTTPAEGSPAPIN
tara:strand:- start:10753 stop:12870 length:2118 start_codon:yes stop_codon:yes gene_type:complete